ncbi:MULTISPECIES: hypothetical protein [Streptomyces]|nr:MULTISPECIES: hypothetical protein [Streptomyces]
MVVKPPGSPTATADRHLGTGFTSAPGADTGDPQPRFHPSD